MQDIHETLRLERLKARMPQWVLSKKTGIDVPKLSRFENGYQRLRPNEINKIREVLGLLGEGN